MDYLFFPLEFQKSLNFHLNASNRDVFALPHLGHVVSI